MKKLLLILIPLTFLLQACAGVQISRITRDNPYKEGIRFYRPYPYLLITKDKQGENLECKIVYLPKTDEEYVVRTKSGIGSVDTKFTLEEGWNLTQFGETRDSKSPEMIEALTGSLKELKGLKAERNGELRPGLYAFVFDENTGLVTDIKPVFQFN